MRSWDDNGGSRTTSELSLTRALACRLVAAELDGWPPRRVDHHAHCYACYLTFLRRLGHTPPFALALLEPRLIHLAAYWLWTSPDDGPRKARDVGITLLNAARWLSEQKWIDFLF